MPGEGVDNSQPIGLIVDAIGKVAPAVAVSHPLFAHGDGSGGFAPVFSYKQKFSNSILAVAWSLSGFVSAPQLAGAGFYDTWVSPGSIDSTQLFFNTANEHLTLPTAITDIKPTGPAGTVHPITARSDGTLQIDANDILQLTVFELLTTP